MSPNHGAGLVVVGFSLAAINGLEAVRRHGFDGRITVLGREEFLPYDRPPLSKSFLTNEETAVQYLISAERLAELDVDYHLGSEATGLDLDSRIVYVGPKPFSYEKLLITTGVQACPVPFAPRHGLYSLRTADNAVRIRSGLRKACHVVIVGAGVIGCEVASSARALGAEVTLVEAANVPAVRAFGEPVAMALSDLHQHNGTRLLTGTRVIDVAGDDTIKGVHLDTGEYVEADLVVFGVGATPATQWLVSSGIKLHDVDRGIICDDYLQTSANHVYAAGDIVHWPNGIPGSTIRLENWTNAADQGVRAAINAVLPEQVSAYATVPYFWSDWYGNRIQCAGSTSAEEITFIAGGRQTDRFVALYHNGNRVIGAVTLNAASKIMKLRRLIGSGGTVENARAFAAPAGTPAS